MDQSPIDQIAWGVEPPRRRTPYIKVAYPTPYQPVRGFCLSQKLYTVNTHFWQERTRPCLGSKLLCDACMHGAEPRFNGYLALVIPPTNVLVIAHVTGEAVRGCAALRDKSLNLRGYKVELSRKGKSLRTPMIAVLTPGPDSPNLPPEFDVKQALLNIWGILPGSSPRKGRTIQDAPPAEGEITP